MKVKDFLNKVKANRYTYCNLDKGQIKDFRRLYSYLKKHKDKKVMRFYKPINDLLSLENELDYVKKFRAMELISTQIVH